MENACDNIGSIPGGVPDYTEEVGGVWVQNPMKADKMFKKLPQVPDWVPELADGKRISLRERCEMFQVKFKTKGIEAKIKKFATPKRICECLGCCDVPEGKPQCFFPNAVTSSAFPPPK